MKQSIISAPDGHSREAYLPPSIAVYDFRLENGFAASNLENPGEEEPSDWD